jgi:putative phosphoribosyl transferase
MLFPDRMLAGQFLGGELADYANDPNVLVLGLPRGGVPVAFEVAKAIHAPLSVLVVRKIGIPNHEELAMGAIAPGGVRVLNEQIIHEENISDATIAMMALQEQRELERREQLYQGDRPIPDLEGRTVILVDDGLATGATMLAAIVAVKKQQPDKIVIAVPVAALPTQVKLAELVDETVCILQPDPFYSVGLWYDKFPQITDDEVCELLATAANNFQPSSVSK